jgi:hypothetical protein
LRRYKPVALLPDHYGKLNKMEVDEIIAIAAIVITVVNAAIVVLKYRQRAKNNRKK